MFSMFPRACWHPHGLPMVFMVPMEPHLAHRNLVMADQLQHQVEVL